MGELTYEAIQLFSKEEYEKALKLFRKAIKLANTTQEFYNGYRNIGLTLGKLGKYDNAIEQYHKAIEYDSTDIIKNDLAMSLFHVGQLDAGLSYYKSRYKISEKDDSPKFPILPISWANDITDFSDKDVLILNEQGFGDEILFSRAIPEICKIAKSVTWQVYPELISLFNEIYKYDNLKFFSDRNFDQTFVSNFDIYSCSGDCFIYLKDKFNVYDKIEKINFTNLHIGTSHKAAKNIRNFANKNFHLMKSIDKSVLKRFTKLGNLYNYSFDEDLEFAKNYDKPIDFKQTADRMKLDNINLVVTIDSAFAHLSGLLQIPTLVIINKYHDWRWKYTNEHGFNMFFPTVKVINLENVDTLIQYASR